MASIQDFALEAKSAGMCKLGQEGSWSVLRAGRCRASASGAWQSSPTGAERRHSEWADFVTVKPKAELLHCMKGKV